jgi:hypothetical protein
MGLLDELKTPPAKVYVCAVRKLAGTLDKGDAVTLLAAVDNPDWPMKTLSTALRQKGISLGQSPIRLHRLKTCSCYA